MKNVSQAFILFWKSVPVFLHGIVRFFSRLFFLDLWRNPQARPVLFFALIIISSGTFIFHWLEGWDYLDSLYFVIITLTTIGYGDLVPTTTLSKVITIFYGINGIVLLLVLFDLIRRVRSAEFMKQAQMRKQPYPAVAKKNADDAQPATPKMTENLQTPPIGKPSGKGIVKNTITKLFLLDLLRDTQSRWVLFFAAVVIALGGLAFYNVEGWSFFNSIYFMFITMTTIGYGDFSPDSDWGKVLTIFFGLNGIVVLLSLYDRIRAVRGQEKSIE